MELTLSLEGNVQVKIDKIISKNNNNLFTNHVMCVCLATWKTLQQIHLAGAPASRELDQVISCYC